MSRNGSKLSAAKLSKDQCRLVKARLERVFRYYNRQAGPASKDRHTHDFAFHMTDWYDDLVKLSALYQRPRSHPQKEWNEVVYSFLIHAVGHLMAAADLNDALLDPFSVAKRAKGPVARKSKVPRASAA